MEWDQVNGWAHTRCTATKACTSSVSNNVALKSHQVACTSSVSNNVALKSHQVACTASVTDKTIQKTDTKPCSHGNTSGAHWQ